MKKILYAMFLYKYNIHIYVYLLLDLSMLKKLMIFYAFFCNKFLDRGLCFCLFPTVGANGRAWRRSSCFLLLLLLLPSFFSCASLFLLFTCAPLITKLLVTG